jgi:hypothetical protein
MLAFMLSAAPATQAATTVHDTFIVPFDRVLFNPCTGEDVAFSGHVVVTSATTIDDHGGFHGHVTSTPRAVRGTGVSSGITYAAVGATLDTLYSAPNQTPFVSVFTSTFTLVSPGASENVQIRLAGHVTLTANGDLSAVFSTFSLQCTG